MGEVGKRRQPRRESGEADDRAGELDPAMARLLDHLAEELAREYVRLMEIAAEFTDASPREPEHEGR